MTRATWTLLGGRACAGILGAAAPPLHIELVASAPAADSTVTQSPDELRLWFSAPLDVARSGAGLRGPDGSVKLGAAAGAEDPKVLVVPILDPLGPGTYTVSWTAAPLEDHGVRGRFRFTVAAAD